MESCGIGFQLFSFRFFFLILLLFKIHFFGQVIAMAVEIFVKVIKNYVPALAA